MKQQKRKSQKKHQTGSLLWLKLLVPVLIILVIGFLYWTVQVASNSDVGHHKMADGVAKFYATFRKNFGPGEEQLDDYIIKLPEPSESLTEQLQQRKSSVQPAPRDWRGSTKRRTFKENDTIRSALQAFAEEEGMELIWNLKYDYIIKHHFVEQVSYKRLLNKVASTVGNDYGAEVKTYFCPLERALIITVEEERYVSEFCESTLSRRQQLFKNQQEDEYKLKKRLGLL